MKLTLVRNKTDSAMIEIRQQHNGEELLCCVVHEDVFEDTGDDSINYALEANDEANVELKLSV